MVFASKEARTQLLTKGIVFTVRKKSKREGKDWANAHYRGKKIADINIKLVKVIQIKSDLIKTQTLIGELEPYWDRSGFANVWAWVAQIIDFCDGIPNTLYLYEVTKI